jgi:hypothetical protein
MLVIVAIRPCGLACALEQPLHGRGAVITEQAAQLRDDFATRGFGSQEEPCDGDDDDENGCDRE